MTILSILGFFNINFNGQQEVSRKANTNVFIIQLQIKVDTNCTSTLKTIEKLKCNDS